MSESASASEAAARAVVLLRQAERLAASAGFYGETENIRKERQRIERCSVQSVDDLAPDHGDYSPRTIGKLADDQPPA